MTRLKKACCVYCGTSDGYSYSFTSCAYKMSIFKKKGGLVNAANVHMTEAEAALAQSDFNIEKITEIQNKFAGGALLLAPGRIFIREGSLYKVCRKGLKKRQFFLFNDILVYGSIVAGRYSNQQILPLSQMSVSSDCFYQPRVDADFISETDEENLDVANAFQISHANKSFHVFGQSAADKANWIANLQKHISRVAKTIQDSEQQVLTRPVWVPDSMSKECMICSTKFTAFLRKHHCRRCGRVICSSCSPHRVALVVGEGGSVSSGSGEGQGKLERTCRDCFKEMTAVHNRANSVGKTKKGTTTPSRPPPPAEAAKIVSAALQTITSPTKEEAGPPSSTEHMDDSTDTEDSDDSGNEQEDDKPPAAPVPVKRLTTSPIPAKRSSTGKLEPQKPVPVARHSHKGETTPPTTPPIPLARRSLKTSSAENSSTLPENEKASNHVEEADNEPKPTPPPRKKKLMKQKLKEQQESEKMEEEKEEKDLPEGTESSPDQSDSSKKAHRRNKYSKPHEETKVSENENSAALESEARIGVEGETRDGVKSEVCDGEEGETRDGVEGETRDGVESETRGGVESETRDGVEGEQLKEETQNSHVEADIPAKLDSENGGDHDGGEGVKSEGGGSGEVQSEPVNSDNTETKTVTNTHTENGEAAGNGLTETEKVENSPSGAKRRRRQKFKPSTPQN